MEMEMEMEMSIPSAEELELLESTSFFPEDEFDEFLEEPPLEEPDGLLKPQPPKNPISQTPNKPNPFLPPEPQSGTKKRSLLEASPTLPNPDPPLVGKRSKIDSSAGTEIDDEDWLRYSPPPPPPPPEEPIIVEEPLRPLSESVVVVEEVEKFVSRYAWEIEGECVPVTAPDGERVYAKISREDNKLKKLDLNIPSKGLIPDPINVLIQRVEHNAFEKALKASVECPSDVILPEVAVVSEQLWVDKYAPNSFMELLSDEQTNREVLMWLKQWDSCVFGSEIKSTTNEVLSALKRHSSGVQHQKTSNKSSFGRNCVTQFNKETLTELHNMDHGNSDSKGIQEWNKKRNGSGPPEHKILLLCGPPGLGKTTLAHVAARHCGYRVVEINASDDRASSTIEAKILDVVQMNSVMSDSRPKCLVIDEIDGALGDGKGAVDVILKMVSADKRSDTGKENIAQVGSSGKMSAKKKHKDTSLLRPVICICNDLYTPALRPLRQVAKVHIFVQPTASRIVNRLKYICNKEGMKTNSISLTALAEYTECDIRSCLNTLQFLNKKKESLNVLDISSQVVGRKDTSKSVFDIWKEIFQKRRVRRERKSAGGGCKSMLNEFDSLHFMISSRGDYDLIMDGIHENILQLRYHDPMMQKTVKCFHSLEVSDILNQYAMRTQRMSLQVYQPAIAINVHGQIAQVEKPNIEWPKSFQRYRTTSAEKVDILHSWHNKISPYISRHLSAKSFVEDLISPLLHILSPPTLRPVALHLLSEKEKKDMAQLVTTMVSYSITYRNTKSDAVRGSLRNDDAIDASLLSFDPPIGEFINFKGYPSSYYALSAAVKQVLCHEVEKQKILQAGVSKSMHVADVCNAEKQAPAGSEIYAGQSSRSDNALVSAKKLPNSRHCVIASSDASTPASSSSVRTNEKLRSSESTQKRSSGSRNFFDRFKKVSVNGSQITDNVKPVDATMERDSRPILFKFNEGFTNAVKRPVRIREFLQ